jgi:hypothetical protein
MKKMDPARGAKTLAMLSSKQLATVNGGGKFHWIHPAVAGDNGGGGTSEKPT